MADEERPGDQPSAMPEVAPPEKPLEGPALIKEVCRLIREARSEWDAHNNASCRRIRGRALRLYLTLTEEQKEQIPQVLRVWLRYRSEKYFGVRKKRPKKKAQPGARKK
jgi:hypothetical protein